MENKFIILPYFRSLDILLQQFLETFIAKTASLVTIYFLQVSRTTQVINSSFNLAAYK